MPWSRQAAETDRPAVCAPQKPIAAAKSRNQQKKFSSRVRNQADKISACDNITICFGSCLRMVVTAPIAPEPERYPCLVRRRDSICAQTVLDSHW